MAEITRRELLARAGLATGAVALGKVERADAASDLTDWRAVRAQFALSPDRIHLTSFLLAAHPRPVREAIDRHRRRLDANPVEYLHANEGRLTAEARSAAGRFLGVPAPEVALTDSTTMGLGLLYTRLALATAGRGLDHRARLLRHARGAPALGCARAAGAPVRRLTERIGRRDRDEAKTCGDGEDAGRRADVGALEHRA